MIGSLGSHLQHCSTRRYASHRRHGSMIGSLGFRIMRYASHLQHCSTMRYASHRRHGRRTGGHRGVAVFIVVMYVTAWRKPRRMTWLRSRVARADRSTGGESLIVLIRQCHIGIIQHHHRILRIDGFDVLNGRQMCCWRDFFSGLHRYAWRAWFLIRFDFASVPIRHGRLDLCALWRLGASLKWFSPCGHFGNMLNVFRVPTHFHFVLKTFNVV